MGIYRYRLYSKRERCAGDGAIKRNEIPKVNILQKDVLLYLPRRNEIFFCWTLLALHREPM